MVERFSVIVLGLGAMGSAAIYQLAKRGVKALGIDRYHPPHALGSTHGETRLTRQAIGEGPHYTPMSLRSYEIFRELEKLTGENLLTVTGGLMISSERRTDSVHVEGFFTNTLEAARKYDIAHTVLDATEMRHRFPQFAVKDDEVGYYEHEAGFLRPERCVQTQIELAKALGAHIHVNECVTSVSETSSTVRLQTDTGTEYECEQLIVSAGPWMPELFAGRCPSIFTVTRQILFWFDIERNYESFVPPTFPIFIWEPQGGETMYGVPAIDGVKGGFKIASAKYMESTSPATVDRMVAPNEMKKMYDNQVSKFFPLAGHKCVGAAVCLYTCTPTSEFVIDRLSNNSRIILCSACSGHGFKHSAAIGEIVSLLATGNQSPIDISNCRTAVV